ncbi:MAG: hypothetical protein J1F42_09875 [Lachnospiraceae bacterium]|nr:hypothetical protein [Lachnospiraceae bacterium]
MIRLRSVRRLGLLLFLCISCVVVMKVLAFGNKDTSSGQDKGEETIVGWMIDKVASGEVELSDESSIRKAIDEGEEEFGIALTEENKARVVEFMKTLDTVESGAGDFVEQARQMYQKYGTEFVEQANDAINGAVKNAAKDAVRSFFESIIPGKDE